MEGTYQLTDPLSEYVPSTTLRQLSTSFRDASQPHFREHIRSTRERCESPITLEEVLSLKTLFYVVLREGHIVSYDQVVQRNDGSFRILTVATYDELEGQPLYVDDTRLLWNASELGASGEIVRFGLKAVRDVLTKVRECHGAYAKNLMMDDVCSAMGELSSMRDILAGYMYADLVANGVRGDYLPAGEAAELLLKIYDEMEW